MHTVLSAEWGNYYKAIPSSSSPMTRQEICSPLIRAKDATTPCPGFCRDWVQGHILPLLATSIFVGIHGLLSALLGRNIEVLGTCRSLYHQS